jgi:hypothetical protein
MSALTKFFVDAPIPSTAAGFADDNFSVIDLRKGRREFIVSSSAATQLPPGLVVPAFDSPNIADPVALADVIARTAEAAGLANRRRWSVALPDSTARTLLVQLESKPSNRNELREILEWKIERVIATPPSQLRISRQRISPVGGNERYLLTLAREDVVGQYESVFASLGWKVGLVLPRHMGEAQWLVWDEAIGDKMLVSANRNGFTALVVRNQEPALVRSFLCDPSSRGDELHRFMLYYRDRIGNGASPQMSRMLVLGGIDVGQARRAVFEALDSQPAIIDPSDLGFDLASEGITFEQIAGAAGLASLGWQ